MNNDFICVNVVNGNSKESVILHTRIIRSVHAVSPKGGNCPHYNAGARTYLLVDYMSIEESIIYVTEELMYVASLLQPLGMPK